ncbi:transcriptional regulator ATRX homolog isoform X2 [Daphnia pulicaria]|uniref:transcriptional regulator ATRX homolog isoform X2 n=1 Tax=Daphnia pulicaria TaxID=35523 RepID=UPI001EEB89D5|nr:transcriptional regulator ATRX homolog isoform X2 [Daphnia pulicaria]
MKETERSQKTTKLFLISTKAGGVGINWVAANRVILFDASWNPSQDVPSIFRVYRLGQTKPCFVYRFIAQGTIEEKIYDQQVTKQSLSCRVIDEHQIKRHFSEGDLNKFYVYDPNSHLNRPPSPKPRDSLLADLALERKDWLLAFPEHFIFNISHR